MAQPKVKLGELLVQENVINMQQLQNAKNEQKSKGGRLVEHLTSLGYINERAMAEFLGKKFNVSTVNLDKFDLDSALCKMVPKELCVKHTIVPISKIGNTVVFAVSDPGHQRTVVDDLRYVTHSKVELVVATESSIKAAITKLYGSSESEDMRTLVENIAVSNDIIEIKGGVEDVEAVDISEANDDPVVKLVNSMLIGSIREGASDIHVEPYEKNFRVRYRIDGNLYERATPPLAAATAVSSRIKILSKLDIAERRLPQDGRLSVKLADGRKVDFRVSILPTMFGEKVVLRILDKESLKLDLGRLGFEPDTLELVRRMIHLPQGMVLLTGPTGSGKTTTIYSALAELNTSDVNICTAEDPVEFNLEGINQVQVRPEIDLTFASALRSFLRQDPDIVLVGEIRDLETAEIAFKAASTGHLVVSTLHTNDAPATVTRLIDIGIEPYLVGATVNLILAQRLIAKLCESCKEPEKVEESVLLDVGFREDEIAKVQLFRANGCRVCNGVGYKGRLAVYEALEMTEPIREAIMLSKNEKEIRKVAVDAGMRSLRRSGLEKVKIGLSTIEEIVKVTMKG